MKRQKGSAIVAIGIPAVCALRWTLFQEDRIGIDGVYRLWR